jgi:hypothetical protein
MRNIKTNIIAPNMQLMITGIKGSLMNTPILTSKFENAPAKEPMTPPKIYGMTHLPLLAPIAIPPITNPTINAVIRNCAAIDIEFLLPRVTSVLARKGTISRRENCVSQASVARIERQRNPGPAF